MAYFAPYVDAAGLHIPTYVDIRDDLIAQYKTIYGEDIYLENDSQDYQMISAYALKTYDVMQLLQIVYNNHSPKTAVGTGLSSIVKLNGIARKAASYSTVVLTLTGRIGTVIAAGIVQDSAGVLWDLPANVEFTAETIEVTAQCETIGAIQAAVGMVTTINTPQAGWFSVTNKVPAVLGQPVETDAELRERQTISVSLPSVNMLEGTTAQLLAIDGVTRVKVYDNDTSVTDEHGIPSHSIAAIVEGGLDDDIALAIYMHKGTGGGTFGSTTHGVENVVTGEIIDIQYSRPTYTNIDVDVKVKRGRGYTAEQLTYIQTAVEEYLSNLEIGAAVTMTGVLTAITSVVNDKNNPPFLLAKVEIGEMGGDVGYSDVEIAYNAVAAVGIVTVEEVA